MVKKVTTASLKKMKSEFKKITMLTAYEYSTATIFDKAGIDMLLVGDSLGMVVLGYEDTTKVTMEDMLHHTKAVSRGAKRAMVVADMPFLSYHLGKHTSVKNAGRLIREGNAGAVKLEGGKEVVEDVKAIINAGIPVMGHLGLTPQSVHQLGGYFIQGKTVDEAKKIIEDAKALEEAGVFALVLECVPTELAQEISEVLSIPTIGIGAGNYCDGQVLVSHDVLGIYQKYIPKFVKQYAKLGEQMESAVKSYIEEVQNGIFPDEPYQFHVDYKKMESNE